MSASVGRTGGPGRMRRRLGSIALIGVMLAGVMAGPAAPAASAHGGGHFLMWDEGGSDFRVFGPNAAVTIYAGLIDFFCDGLGGPVADIYVVADEPALGDFLEDVSPSPNTVFAASGGLFIEETVGFTVPSGQLTAGWYTVVYDECQDGIFGFEDTAFVDAFYVDLPAEIPPIDPRIAQIKARAAVRATTFDQYDELLDNLDRMEKALKIAEAAQTCLAGPLAFQAVCGMELAMDLGGDFFKDQVCEALVAGQGVGCAKEMAKDVIADSRKHYQAIAADPPDPGFSVPAPLAAVAAIPMTDPDPLTAAHLGLANALATEAALAEALLHAVERYQGADAAGDARWALGQVRGARDIAAHLRDQLARVGPAAAALEGEIRSRAAIVDAAVALVDPIQDAIGAGGFAPQDERALRNLGLDAATIAAIESAVAAANVDGLSGSGLAADAAAIAGETASAAADVDALILELDAQIAALAGDASTPDDLPLAAPGGPYAATEGVAVTLDGSASASASTYALTSYAWDLDRDGQFDDAAGATPTWTFPAAFDGLIGLRVIDRHGLVDVGYARVATGDANGAPTISSFSPAATPVEVEVGASQTFSIDASDPDGDGLSVSWLLDADPAAVGSGFSFAFAPIAVDVGAHTLAAFVTDNRTDGGAQVVSWQVLVRQVDADADLWTATTDCDDADASVNPGQPEVLLNGKDDDCDPATSDEGSAPTAAFVSSAASGGRNVALYDASLFVTTPSAVSAIPVAQSPAFNTSHTMIAALNAGTEDFPWATTPATPRYGVVRLWGSSTWLIDRVAVMPRTDFSTQRVRAFAIDVSTTGFVSESDWTQVLAAEAADSAALQTFVLPGGPVPARYVRIRLLSNRGDPTYISVEQFKVYSPQHSGGTTFDFEDRSTDPENDIVSRLWSFGDGGTSVSDNPSHTYAGPGTYTVTLTETDSRAHSSSYSLVHRVLVPPTGAFPTPATVNEKGSIGTSGYVVSDPDGDRIVRMTWDWGDGTAVTVQASATAPTHQYQQDGVYTVRLTVTDAQEQVTFVDRTATVLNVPPTASLANQTVASGVRFRYSAASSDVADPVTCTWDFGDGTPLVAGCGTQAHAYPALAAGAPDALYTQTFRVSDDDTAVTGTAVVTVTATFANRTVPDGLTFTYQPPSYLAAASGPVTCLWDFGDGSPLVAGCGAQLHAYPAMAAGAPDALYPLTFRITDSGGTGPLRATVTVQGNATTPFFSTNFTTGVPSQMSGVTTTEPVQGYAGYGFDGSFLRNAGSTHSTSLTLAGLPAHTSIDLGFLLAIIDSWDGNSCFAGPDTFYVKVDGTLRFSKVFENSRCGTQAYAPPPDVELARHLDLGFTGPGGYFTDAAYNMGFDPIFQGIPHTASTLTIEWYSTHVGVANAGDESWGLDNLEVFLNGGSNATPVADAGGPYATNEGHQVSLDGSGSSDADGGVLTYAWDLDDDGDFDDATGSTASITPDDGPATLTVRLRVTDPDGASSTDSATITVSNVAPVATLSVSASVVEGGTYSISLGGASDPSTADAGALEYAFDCGLGAGYAAFGSTPSVDCTAGDDDADAAVQAKVRDDDGGEHEYTATVPVLNAPPTGTFGATSPILEGSSSTLAWTDVSDPSAVDAVALRYSFACDSLLASPTGSWLLAATTPSTSCLFDDDGDHSVTGRVLDPDNASQTTGTSVTVTNVAPTATLSAPATIAEGMTFDLALIDAGDVSSADTVAGFTFAFDCGDGFGGWSAEATASCPAPANDGSLEVAARIRDKDDGIRRYTATISVSNIAPVVSLSSDSPAPWGLSVGFEATASDPSVADEAGLTFWWDFNGDGTFEAGPFTSSTRTSTYPAPGVFTAAVRACDDDACTTATADVTVTRRGTELLDRTVPSIQYSDPLAVRSTLRDTVVDVPVSGRTVDITAGPYAGSDGSDGAGQAAATFVVGLPSGSIPTRAEFDGDPYYRSSFVEGSVSILQEDADLVYTGDTFATGTSARLAATVTEAADGSLGDITHASVTFDVYVGTTACGSSVTPTRYGPVAVTDTGTQGDGIGSAEYTMPTPGEQTYCIVARLTGAGQLNQNSYYAAIPAQNAVLTVVATTGKFATGGGWIVDPATGGHGNFGFTARFTKSGTPKGQSVYVWRSRYEGVLADFIMKSNSITGLSFADERGTGTFPWRATMDGKATIRIIRASDRADLLNDGNATFRLVAVDSGQSSGAGVDSFALRVLDKDGVEYKLVGTWSGPTCSGGVLLSGGNVMVHLN